MSYINNLSSKILNKSHILVKIILEKINRNGLKGGTIFNLDCVNSQMDLLNNNWSILYTTPEGNHFNSTMVKVLFTKIFTNIISKMNHIPQNNDLEYIFNSCLAIYLNLINKGNHGQLFIDLYDILLKLTINPILDIKKNFDSILNTIEKLYYNEFADIKLLFNNFNFNKDILEEYFVSSDNLITELRVKNNEGLLPDGTQKLWYIEPGFFPTYDDIITDAYLPKFEKNHLIKPNNRVVHNGIHNIDTIGQLLKLFGKNIDDYPNFKHEINYIHGYLHEMDTFISVNGIDVTKIQDYTSKLTDIYIKHCFEILANSNRYYFLEKVVGTNDFLLTNNDYVSNLTEAEMKQKKTQAGLEEKDPFVLRSMIKDPKILPIATSTLWYPLNDPYTNEILTIKEPRNLDKFQNIHKHFIKLLKIHSPKILTKEALTRIVTEVMQTVSYSINPNDILLYLKYNREKERYNIDLSDRGGFGFTLKGIFGGPPKTSVTTPIKTSVTTPTKSSISDTVYQEDDKVKVKGLTTEKFLKYNDQVGKIIKLNSQEEGKKQRHKIEFYIDGHFITEDFQPINFDKV
jgi:hypothetical protein